RVWQGLDCCPQLIDQRLAVADLPPLFGAGQRVPQRQQPLAVERSGVQFSLRGDGNLAVIFRGRHLAAQCDSVIANDVDAHGWVLPVGPGRRPLPPVTHTHALFAEQSHSIPANLVALLRRSRAWNCSDPEPMIRRTRDRQYGWLAEL